MLEGPEQNPELGLLAHYCFYVIANYVIANTYAMPLCNSFYILCLKSDLEQVKLEVVF